MKRLLFLALILTAAGVFPASADDRWNGVGWYIWYRDSLLGDKHIVRGPYDSKDQCVSNRSQLAEDWNWSGANDYDCDYFGSQADWNQVEEMTPDDNGSR